MDKTYLGFFFLLLLNREGKIVERKFPARERLRIRAKEQKQRGEKEPARIRVEMRESK